VISVHELHCWRLVNTRIIASLHITCLKGEDFMILAPLIQKICHNYGIHSTTVQPEFLTCAPQVNEKCHLPCLPGCVENTCCPQTNKI
jgi:zinc transporter 1